MAYEINFCETKEQLKHLAEVASGKVDGSPSGADIDESTLSYTGQVRRTLPKLIDQFDQQRAILDAEADEAINTYRRINAGDYLSGPLLLDDKFTYAKYNGGRFYAVNPPYTTDPTTFPDPSDDTVNLKEISLLDEQTMRSIANQTAEQILDGEIFPEDYDQSLQNWDTVPVGTTYLRVLKGPTVTVVLMSPIADGIVSNLTQSGATVGGVDVIFYEVPSIPQNTVNLDDFSGTDYEKAQAAFDVMYEAGSGVVIFPGRLYNFSQPALLYSSNVVVKFEKGATWGADQNPFLVIPKSLLDSGRLTGDDYPLSWRDVSNNPTPFEGDFFAMAHEEDTTKRIKNITFSGVDFKDIQGTFVTAMSVDNLWFVNAETKAINRSSVRLYHCDGAFITRNNFNDTGIYSVFAFKCANVNLFKNKGVFSDTRPFSWKGSYHGTNSIFGPNSTDRINTNIVINNNNYKLQNQTQINTFFGLGNVDSTWYTDDAALDAGAAGAIGFTKMQWRGQYSRGYKVLRNVLQSDSPALMTSVGGENQSDVSIHGNDCLNLSVQIFYVDSADVSENNNFDYDQTISTSPIDARFDSRLNSSPRMVMIRGNQFTDVEGANEVVRGVIQGGRISGNIFNCPRMNRDILCTTGSDGLLITNNISFIDDTSTKTLVVTKVAGGNSNGIEHGNTLVNTETPAVTQDGSVFKGNDSDGGISALRIKQASQYAGMVFEDSAGEQALRIYYDSDSDSSFIRSQGSPLAGLVVRGSGLSGFRGQVNSTSANSGAASSLPGNPEGYVTLDINGAPKKIPYWNE